mgnify:CR=1 FL=1
MQQTLQAHTPLKKNSSLLSSKLDNEYVMMSIENGEYYGLNTIASRIWDLLQQLTTAEKIIGILMNEFHVEEQQCRSDVMAFLRALQEKNLIIISTDDKV